MYFLVTMKRSVVLFDEPLTTASLERKLVRLGFGTFQLQTIIACGFFVFYHSSISTLNRELLEQSKSPFGDNGIQKLMFAIAPFLGSILGCLVSSTEWFSRKFLVIFSYAVVGLCTLMAAMSSSLYITILWLGLAHVGFGLGLPAAILTVYESSPLNRRPVALSLLFTFHIMGEVYVGIMNRLAPLFPTLCSPTKPLCDYRVFGLESVAIPMFIALILSAFWVHESPFSMESDCFKLNNLLRHIRETNGLVESDVVIKFVPKSDAKRVVGKISTTNLFILGSIFFAVESFHFIFPHPDNHWLVSASLSLFSIAIASGVSSLVGGSTRPISVVLFFQTFLCVLGAWTVSTSIWAHHVQSWFVLGVLKACSLALLVLATVFVCEVSPRYMSQILAIAYAGCILFPNSIEITSAVPIEIVYAVVFALVGIAATNVGSKCEEEPLVDKMGNFSKIALIGQLPQPNYGSSGA